MFLQSSALAAWSLPGSPSLRDSGEIEILPRMQALGGQACAVCGC